MKIAALGRTQWLYESIRTLTARGHQMVLIGTCPAAAESTVTEEEFARLAKELDCPFFCDASINQARYAQLARDSEAEAAISVNWLTRIEDAMRQPFRHGIINAHAGDLPRFRGNAAPNWAILTGEPRIVLTLHRMTDTLDHGPILAQQAMALTPSTYIADVYRFLERQIPALFAEVIDGLAAGTLTPRMPQDDPRQALRCFPRLPRDGAIDWTHSALELDRLVRASAEPFAGAYSFLGIEKVIVWRAHAEALSTRALGVPGQVIEIRRERGEIVVFTGDGVLVLEELQTSADGRHRAAEVITSARTRLGLDAAEAIGRLTARIAQLEAQVKHDDAVQEPLR